VVRKQHKQSGTIISYYPLYSSIISTRGREEKRKNEEKTYNSKSKVHGIRILVYPWYMCFLPWHGWDTGCEKDVD
jgi:hypothetical protein